MKLQLQRITLSGDIQAVEFDRLCGKYLVKNFSEGDIFVSFESELVEEESIKIASGCGQVCLLNEYLDWDKSTKSKTIYIKGEGEVEVQQLCYR